MDETNCGFEPPTHVPRAKAEALPNEKNARMEFARTIRLAAAAGIVGSSLGGALGSDLWAWTKQLVAWIWLNSHFAFRWGPGP